VNEEQLIEHLEQCRRAMEASQEAFERQYDLAQYPTYWGDADGIVLKERSGSGARREFAVVFIGRHAPDDRFTWGWADQSLPEGARERSAAIKRLSAVTGFQQFETPVIELDPPNLEKVVAVVLDHLNAAACFVDRSGEPRLFVAITGPGAERKATGAECQPTGEERTMGSPTDLLKEVLEVLNGSAEDKLEALFHGINLPPDWFEMVAPPFKSLFGAEIKGSLIDIGELDESQRALLKTTPQEVQDGVKQAIKLDYVVPDSAENERGTLTLPVYCSSQGCKILLVGG
jgi:hypothetical protein